MDNADLFVVWYLVSGFLYAIYSTFKMLPFVQRDIRMGYSRMNSYCALLVAVVACFLIWPLVLICEALDRPQ